MRSTGYGLPLKGPNGAYKGLRDDRICCLGDETILLFVVPLVQVYGNAVIPECCTWVVRQSLPFRWVANFVGKLCHTKGFGLGRRRDPRNY
jgi:hypothetical protein